MASAKPARATSLRAGLKQLKTATLAVTEDGSHEMAVIRIKDLHIDRTYQRVANARRVDTIARNYDMAKAGTIEVSRRDSGGLYIIDGGHRMLGANAAGETEMLAHIHVGLTVEQEAHLFREMNKTRLPIKSLEEYKAGLVEKDARLLEIDAIVHSYGGHIAYDKGDTGGIVAIKSIERVYDQTGPEGLRRVLSVIRDTYGSLHQEHAQENTIKGLSAFIEHYSEAGINPLYRRPRLVKRLQQVGLATLLVQAAQFHGIYRGSMWINVARATVQIYNAALAQANRIPEWESIKK